MVDMTEFLGKTPAEIEQKLSQTADPLIESGEILQKDLDQALCQTVIAIASYLAKRISD